MSWAYSLGRRYALDTTLLVVCTPKPAPLTGRESSLRRFVHMANLRATRGSGEALIPEASCTGLLDQRSGQVACAATGFTACD